MVENTHNPLNNGLPRLILHPGDYRVTRDEVVLSTLLGSCVAVCLYDPVNRVMGMNHFLLAERRHAREPLLASDEGRYGIHAMELLINGMIGLGARRAKLQAKAFGGGNVLGRRCEEGGDDYYCIGDVNVRFIREFLANDKIPLVAEDLGGRVGRQVYFTAPDYSVYLRRMESRLDQVVAEEKRYMEKSRNAHAQAAKKTKVDYW